MTRPRAQSTLRDQPAARAPVLVRNHDLSTDHRLAVRVYGPGGGVVYEEGFVLDPGAVATRDVDLPAGSHTVEADCDAERYLVRTCRLDDGEGLLVAVGNGVLDVAPRPTA